MQCTYGMGEGGRREGRGREDGERRGRRRKRGRRKRRTEAFRGSEMGTKIQRAGREVTCMVWKEMTESEPSLEFKTAERKPSVTRQSDRI
eukprot:767670-Hanusia_phi.AAC.2